MPVTKQREDGRKVDAAPAQIVIDARLAVLLVRRRRGVAAIFGEGVLEAHFGSDSFDRPLDRVLLAPERTGDPEKNVRVDRIERTLCNCATPFEWCDDARDCRRSGTKSGPDELAAIQHGSLLNGKTS